MRSALILLLIVICDRQVSPPAKKPVPVDNFASTVQPILQQRCSPCHFEGGVMYTRLPFDKAATITHLGTKLFGRIKDEESRTIIRTFLAQDSPLSSRAKSRDLGGGKARE